MDKKRIELLEKKKKQIQRDIEKLEQKIRNINVEILSEKTGLKVGNVVQYTGPTYNTANVSLSFAKAIGMIVGVSEFGSSWAWRKIKKNGDLYKNTEVLLDLKVTKLAETLEEYRVEKSLSTANR